MVMFSLVVVLSEIVGEEFLNGGKKPRREIPGFHQERVRARCHAPGPGLGCVVCGHDENDGRIRALFQATCEFRAIQYRHVQIRDHQNRPQ